VQSSTQAAAEAMENMQVPREYHDAVKNYFSTLDKASKDAKKAADKK